ncbi:MAG: sensor histidine kinase [Desulfobacteraceae bacterium]
MEDNNEKHPEESQRKQGPPREFQAPMNDKNPEQALETRAAWLEEKVMERTRELEQANQALQEELKHRKHYQNQLEASESRARSEAARRRHLAGRLVDLLEEDRRELAMLLHDDAGQILTGAKMELESVRADLGQDIGAHAGRIDGVVKSLQTAISCMRDTSRRLRPSSLDMLGLIPALRSLGEGMQNESRRIHFFFKDVPDHPPPRLGLSLYRIAQEAVLNAVRHSGCSEIHVSLTLKGSALQLTIEDNGCGFAWDKVVSEASGVGPLGLVIMRERATHAGGELYVDSSPGKGTTVRAEIPFQEAAPP